ncbi:STAS domain-containing protein [candidate division FCPU426 bacterium]|nr:STAS domain-containing protein [candidate division FCPU426 bacterium]
MQDDIKVHIDMTGTALEIAVIRVAGLVDTDSSRHLSRTLEEVIANGHYKIVVDLHQVDYISSAGWGIFIGELRALRRNNGDLKLARMKPEVEDVYKLLEFFNVLQSFDSVEAAVGDFK